MKKLIYILLILILSSCNKDEPGNETTYSYLNPTLESDYSFQEGSYWVYQDQGMNQDSVVLINFETGFTSTCPDNACARREFIKLNFENITHGLTYNHYFMSDFIRYNGGGAWGQDGQPIFILDRNEGYEFNGLVVRESIDSLIVLNETFYDIKKMSVIADKQYQVEFDYDMDFYFSPSIGVVKFIEYDTLSGAKIWELENYNIE